MHLWRILDQHAEDGKRRRKHIEKLINESQEAHELQRCLTDLYYGSSELKPIDLPHEQHWIAEYKGILIRQDELETRRTELERELKALEVRLEGIGNTNIQELRAKKQDYIDQRNRLNSTLRDHDIEIARLQERHRSLTATHQNLMRRHRRGRRISARLDATRDISQILQHSYDRITNEELQNVSQLMNMLFLEMIGADAEQGATIQRAEISSMILIFSSTARMTAL